MVDPRSDGIVRYKFTAEQLADGSVGIYGAQIEVFWTSTESEIVVCTDSATVLKHVGTHPSA
jgi:hypothetical protein